MFHVDPTIFWGSGSDHCHGCLGAWLSGCAKLGGYDTPGPFKKSHEWISCVWDPKMSESDTHKEATGTYLEGKGSLKLGFSLKYSNKKLRCRHQGAAKKIHLFGNQVWRCSWWHRDNSTWLREPREELELWKSGVVSSLWRGRRWFFVKLVDDSTSRFLWQIPTWFLFSLDWPLDNDLESATDLWQCGRFKFEAENHWEHH